MKKTLLATVFLPALALTVSPVMGPASGEATTASGAPASAAASSSAAEPFGELAAYEAAAQMSATVVLTEAHVDEGDSGMEQIRLYCMIGLTNPIGMDVTGVYTLSDGTALFNVDYGSFSVGTFFVAAGQTSTCIPVSVFGGPFGVDSEPHEFFNVTVGNIQNAAPPASPTIRAWIDNDDNYAFLMQEQNSVDEGDMSLLDTVTYTLQVTPTMVFSSSVSFTTRDGTAEASDNDYVSASPTVMVPASTASSSFVIQIEGDNHAENNEWLFLDPIDTVNVKFVGNQAYIVIDDNDSNCGNVIDGFGGTHFTTGGGCTSNAPSGPADADPPLPMTPYFGFDIARDMEYANRGYYVLDGFGGLHADGGAPVLSPAPPYFGFDAAEDLEFLCDGSGALVLDAFGGVHTVAGAAGVSPAPPYFGFDVARDMELTCPGLGVNVLDGFGGMHAGNGAPVLNPAPPYFGFDIARDFELPCTGAGAFVLDGFGGVHAIGGASPINPTTPYFGFDAAVDMELMCPATGYAVLDGFGGFHYGGAAVAVSPTPPYFGFHIARDFEGIQ